MMKLFGIALGAGVTSAVLTAVMTTHTLAGLLLAQLAPLPIMIVGLAFPPAVGAAAALIGAGAIALVGGPVAGLVVFVFSTLPAWLLCHLAVRVRTPADGDGPDAPGPNFTSVSTLLLALTGLACAPVLLAGGALLWRFGGYERTMAWAARRISALLAGSPSPLPGELPVDVIVQVAPISFAVFGVLVLGINLWLAARSVQLSGWLNRPWPNLPDGLRLPRTAVGVLAILGVAVMLPDPFGLAAAVVVGALGLAFAFEGLAALHVVTRGLTARAAILAGLYLATLAVEPWALLALVLAGCLDSLVPTLRRGALIKITKLPKRRQ